jgi:HSP20 family molecular chaperone IbpA
MSEPVKTSANSQKEKKSGNMKEKCSENTGSGKTIEPAITLQDEGKFLRIIAELPGISEEKIRIDLEKTSVTIVASDTVKQFKKVITVPCEVRFSRKRFSDGILELILEKTDTHST